MNCLCKGCASLVFKKIEDFIQHGGLCRRCKGINYLFTLELRNYPQHLLGSYYRKHVVIAFNRKELLGLVNKLPLGYESDGKFNADDWQITQTRAIRKPAGILGNKSLHCGVNTRSALRAYAKSHVAPYVANGYDWMLNDAGNAIEVYNVAEFEAVKAKDRKSFESSTVIKVTG